MTLAPGTLVGGRFRVERLAGAGGMGEVHRAIDLESARPVAIKITRQTVDEEARFLRETRLLETLSDPAIVGYLGHGRLEDGRPFLAMEWLEGESLSDRLERGTLAPHEVTHVVRAVARALGVAHRRGIVHRDIKPSNVFLVGQAVGEGAIDGADVRLIDFGIARHHALRGATVTKTDAAIGTPHYMAPEQVRGSKSVGPAADVFALGCLLYECLVGRSPFVSETMLAALAAVLLEEPEPPRKLVPAISPELERLVLRMLSKDASQRPPDGDAVVRELDALGGGARDPSVSLGALTFAGLSHREQRLVLVLVALPSEERRATDATQRADEPDRTTIELRGIVERSDGRVELSAEGALVASFSDEGATRDRVARARRCARRLLDADASVRIGIVAGRTVAGRVPVGEAVERAIAIARRTGHGASGGIGLDDDVSAFAEESEETRVTGGAPRPKLFGRDREVGAIVSSIDEALGEPIARAIVVEGDTGIGRTAVLEAVLSRVGREMDGATRVLDVRLDAGDHDAPLSVIVRLVRSAAHIEEGESIDVRRDKLAAHVESLEIAPERSAALLRDLGDLARVPIADAESADPTQRDHVMRGDAFLRGDRERRAFHDWIAAVSIEPVLVAIDDAQHADPSSIELLAQALATLVARPLVALAMVRTAPDDTRASLAKVLEGSGDAHVETQRLAPLLPRAAKSLVEQTLPGADAADARAAIVSAGEGNPFFLRELCAAHLRGAEAPTSILAAIEERILRVSEEARRVLRAISLLREPSAPEAIAALVPGLSLPDVGARLDELARSELVEHDVRARVLYRPKSALVADAAYAMIPDDDRRVAHRLAGLGLRDAGAEPSRVGHHLERGGEPILAATSFRDAAERAIEAHDLVVARSHASRGLALVSSALDDTRALAGDLFLRRAEASRWKGEYAVALEDALAALDALEPAGSRERERALRFLEALGIALVASSALGRDPAHEDAQARTWTRAELVLFADPLAFEDDREVVALAVVALCRGAAAWLGRGRREDAARWLARARARAGASPLPIASAWLAALDASWALHDGDLATFLIDTERAVREYERAGDARNACNQRVRLANALVSVGELERAEAALSAAREDAERMGLAVIAGYAVQNLGHVRARLGRVVEARVLLGDALARAERLGDAGLRAGARLYLALLELSSDPREARAHARAARDAVPEGAFSAIAHAIEARACLALDLLEEADSASELASAWLAAHGPIEEGEVAIHRARVDVLEALGRVDEARALASRAYAAIEARADALGETLRAGYLERASDHVRLRSARDPRA